MSFIVEQQRVAGFRSPFAVLQVSLLESITHFHFDTTVEGFVCREGSEEETASEREGLHAETSGNSGIQTHSVHVDIVTIIVIGIEPVIPEMESHTRSHVDARHQLASEVKVVAVVQKQRYLLECGGVETITDTNANNIVVVDGDAIDEDAGKACVFAEKSTILIDEVVLDLLLRLVLSVESACA